ncbi:sigma-70 family RNA polymerase sigma factor [Bacillus sp. NP157]|nr:sigma-70 family RNA polymerase sigma factor [Bacillus sp. NP157]
MPATSPAERDALNDLLRRTAARDEKAFAALYKATSPRLFGVCLRLVGDRAEADDILQEAFVTVWRRAASFDATLSSAFTWLVTVVRNKAIDRLRQRPAHAASELDWDSLVDTAPGPAAEAEAGEAHGRLRACLDELEDTQRRSIREAFFSGATYNELAERAKVPLGTMKSWIRRGLIQLRACLGS